jgi:hypothetical protein
MLYKLYETQRLENDIEETNRRLNEIKLYIQQITPDSNYIGYINTLGVEIHGGLMRIGISPMEWCNFIRYLKSQLTCYSPVSC